MENEEKILDLVRDSHIMYCEAAYLEKDKNLASNDFTLLPGRLVEMAR